MQNGEHNHDQDSATQIYTRQTTSSSAYMPVSIPLSARHKSPPDADENLDTHDLNGTYSNQQDIAANSPLTAPDRPIQPTIYRRRGRSIISTLLLIFVVALALICIGGAVGFVYYTTVTHPAQLHTYATATASALRTAHQQATAQARVQATATGIARIHAQATAHVVATEQAVQAQTTAQVEATITAQNHLLTQSMQGSPMMNDALTVQTRSKWDIYPTQDGGGCAFNTSMYHARVHTHGYYTQCIAHKSRVSNFALDVNMTILQGSQGGVLFRSNSGDNNFYNFRISNDGSYALLLTQGTKNSTLLYDRSKAIKTGTKQTNRLSIIARGANIYLYINAQFLGSVNDTTYTSGTVGFIAVEQSQDTDVAFSHLRVWSL